MRHRRAGTSSWSVIIGIATISGSLYGYTSVRHSLYDYQFNLTYHHFRDTILPTTTMSLRKDLIICDSVEDALKDLKSGASIMAGGFGLAGIPETMIEWVREQENIKNLYFISTEAGDDNWGLGRLYEKNKISKQSCSYIGKCHSMERAYLSGQTELEMIPQGTVRP